jgi:hypothetical protein
MYGKKTFHSGSHSIYISSGKVRNIVADGTAKITIKASGDVTCKACARGKAELNVECSDKSYVDVKMSGNAKLSAVASGESRFCFDGYDDSLCEVSSRDDSTLNCYVKDRSLSRVTSYGRSKAFCDIMEGAKLDIVSTERSEVKFTVHKLGNVSATAKDSSRLRIIDQGGKSTEVVSLHDSRVIMICGGFISRSPVSIKALGNFPSHVRIVGNAELLSSGKVLIGISPDAINSVINGRCFRLLRDMLCPHDL